MNNEYSEKKVLMNRIDELESELRSEKAKNRIIGDSINCGIWEYDIERKVLYQDKKLDGKWSDNNLVIPDYRRTVRSWGLIYIEDIHIFEDYCDSMDRGDPSFTYDLRVCTDFDKYIWLRYVGETVSGNDGKPYKVVGKTLDIDSEMRLREINERKNNTDSLTGLICGQALKDEISHRVSKTSNGKAALFIIDFDDFKRINENMGHLYGDSIIEKFAADLRSIISDGDIIGRLSGDEFAIFKSSIRSHAIASAAAQSLIIMINAIRLKDDSALTASIGVAVYPDDCGSFDDMFRSAELALTKAKSLGKNRYVIYNKNDIYHISAVDLLHSKISAQSDKGNRSLAVNYGSFDNKLIEYAIDVIMSNSASHEVVHSVIMEAGKYYNLCGVYIVETADPDNINVMNKWNTPDFDPDPEPLLKKIARVRNFTEKLFYGSDYKLVTPDISARNYGNIDYLKDITLLMLPIFDNGNLSGFIVFAGDLSANDWKTDMINSLQLITKMITANIFRTRNEKLLDEEVFFTKSILNNQRLQSYCIDPDTYELLHITEYTDTVCENAVGRKCYEVIGGSANPCRNCPASLIRNDSERSSIEYFDEKTETWYSATASSLVSPSGQRMRLICRNDVSQFVEHIRAKDSLTGIMTMDKFNTEAMRYLATKGEKEYCLIYIGFKKFNSINEEWGYSAGDTVLKIFAENMSLILGKNELFARINGDNFLMLLESGSVNDVINRISMAMNSVSTRFEEIYPGINAFLLAGVYKLHPDDWSIESCVDNANIARKSARSCATRRENDFIVFDDDMRKRIQLEKEIETYMFDAVANREFKVFIQPKVDIASRRIKGAEALCRWIRPDGTYISPGDFIRIFEENGFIIELDFYIYQCLCMELRTLLDNGIKPPVISVNVSRAHLIANNSFVDKFCAVIDRYRIPHRYIELELTETMFFDNLDRLLGIINDLHRRGFQISIDDFGSGYSSLNLIKVLPVDVLKIDGEFFMQNEMTEKDKAVISTIFQLAKELRLKTIAEGIETDEQVNFVTECGCDMIQGYYFYKPMPIEEFERIISEQHGV